MHNNSHDDVYILVVYISSHDIDTFQDKEPLLYSSIT